MTDFLKQIETGKKQKPRRVLFYGTHGVGKSTWASHAPEPIYIQTEDGLDDLGVNRFPLAGHLNDVMDMLRELCGQHKYKTLVIDTLDWLEKLIWTEVCVKEKKEQIEQITYGKGYKFALKYWEEIRFALEYIRNKKGMNIILISHSKIERCERPDMDGYDTYSPKLHKTATAMWSEWADEVFFASFKVNVVESGEGFNKKAKGTGEGRRVVYTNERPAYLAKNRLGITENIEMEYSAYSAFFNNTPTGKTKKGDK